MSIGIKIALHFTGTCHPVSIYTPAFVQSDFRFLRNGKPLETPPLTVHGDVLRGIDINSVCITKLINKNQPISSVMEKIIYKEESYKIIGWCMEVHNILGKGFSESVYKKMP